MAVSMPISIDRINWNSTIKVAYPNNASGETHKVNNLIQKARQTHSTSPHSHSAGKGHVCEWVSVSTSPMYGKEKEKRKRKKDRKEKKGHIHQVCPHGMINTNQRYFS